MELPLLISDQDPPWYQDPQSGLCGRGYLYDEQGSCLRGEAMLQWWGKGLVDEESWRQKLQATQGHFALIWQAPRKDYRLAAVDNIRSIPLFYQDHRLSSYVPWAGAEPGAQAELLPYTGHCLHHYTLHRAWRQLQAGEYVKLFPHQAAEVQAYSSLLNQPSPSVPDIWEQAESTFRRLVEGEAAQQAWVLPLSGGYDSRLIATMLKHLGVERVICYTYGKPGNPEALISAQVAKKLGYEWHFVAYDDAVISTYLEEKGLRYQDWASAGASLAHEQDWMAVKKLQAKGLLPEDAIFLPGFGGDVLAGSWYPSQAWRGQSAWLDDLLQGHKFFSGRRDQQLDETQVGAMIQAEIDWLPLEDQTTAFAALQYWGLRNRMSKFLVNAVRVYEYFGYAWRLPFFDPSWVSTWLQVPDELKRGKHHYLAMARERLFIPFGVNVDLASPKQMGARSQIKRWLPTRWIDPLKVWLGQAAHWDHTLARPLAKQFCEHEGWPSGLADRYSLNYLMAQSLLTRHDLAKPGWWLRG
ncbi:MAG: asparagine synthase C-terminal domain-containing protein [Bacteroidota bacterium]